jgi:bifunctional enzyme CysN/CysC
MTPEKTLLRLITCGSVDDGKSTLLGRLLFETGSAFDDELAACGEDLSRLVDGLEAEREQGITIDVAYRFFATDKRKFIVADAPGHEQYTRNLVTGASTAELALVLVDARKGVLGQTRRHAFLCRLLGVSQLVLLVNKMDMVGYDQAVFDRIVAEYREVTQDFVAIPVSAAAGDNVGALSPTMPWYRGTTLIDLLEAVEPVEDASAGAAFRMPVQWVNRFGQDFRGFAGMVASGTIRRGAPVKVMPAGTAASVERIVLGGEDLAEAGGGPVRDLDRSTARSTARAATSSPRQGNCPRSPTSSRRRSSG